MLTHLARDEVQFRLEDVARPLHTVRHTKPAYELLLSFLHHQYYLFAVVDDHGEVVGVVALDDVFEAMLGRTIETEKTTTAK